MKKILYTIMVGVFMLFSLLYFGGAFFLWEKPSQYTGNQLKFHHKQLKDEGFSFLFKSTYPYCYLDTYQYIYKKENLFNQPRYIILTLKSRNDTTVESAEKIAYVFWVSAYGVRTSQPLADEDNIERDDDIINAFLPWKTPIAEHEIFLLN